MVTVHPDCWQAILTAHAQYQWHVVRPLQQQGVDTAPDVVVPDTDDPSRDAIDIAAETFETAIRYCKLHTEPDWETPHRVRAATTALRQLERGLAHIHREQARLDETASEAPAPVTPST